VIRREHRIEVAEIAREREPALTGVAVEVVDAVHALMGDCTVAVVIADVGSGWKMLAQAGPEDLSSSWRGLVADASRAATRPDQKGAVVARLGSSLIRTLLVAVPRAGTSLPSAAVRIVRPLLDAGGILFDATLRDAQIRRIPPTVGR
jgi:hypothetical protein